MPYRRTILVVEDDAGIRQLTAEVLRDEGYRVVAVARHEGATDLLRTFRFGLILADPEGGAPEPWAGLEALRVAAGPTPVVIYSAHAPASFEGYTERGFAGFLPKPFTLDDLLAIVRAHVLAAGRGDPAIDDFLTA